MYEIEYIGVLYEILKELSYGSLKINVAMV